MAGPVEAGLRSLYAYKTDILLTGGLNRTHLLGLKFIHLCVFNYHFRKSVFLKIALFLAINKEHMIFEMQLNLSIDLN